MNTMHAPEHRLDSLPELPLFRAEYKRDPYPYYREWVCNPPFWARLEGKPVVAVARLKDIEAILRDHVRFSSIKPPEPGLERFDFFNGLQDMVHTDPPVHTRLRSILNPMFSPRAVSVLEPRVRALIEQLLDAAASNGNEFEVMTQFARPLSVTLLLGLLLEMDPADFHIFERLAASMVLLSDSKPGSGKPQEYLDAWREAQDYCMRVIEQRRSDPADDLIGHVVSAHLQGKLTADELFVMLLGLFIGGLSSTATLIGNAFVQIVSRPEQYRLLHENPELAASAVEEVMRYDPVGLFIYKFAAEDCEFEGLHIPAGSTIYILNHASGFDPSVNEDPFRFDIRRKNSRHLSFGFGIHVCIGAPIARLATRLALACSARRFPALRLADEVISYSGWQQERSPAAVRLSF